jgi:RNA polymerase sigma-70 factor (ECF subfamily)
MDDERGLIAAAQAGDERAFRRLVETHRAALEIHCYRMLGSLDDAEEIVQETLLRAWRKLEGFERRASVHTWLYRIATNACLDELERRPRRPEPVEPFPDARLASPTYDPAARYALREGMELALLTAIQRLPGRQRATLILRDVLGWSGPEVAQLLDTTLAAVNSALQRARATVDAELPSAPPPAAATERDLLRRYVDAWTRTDVDALVALLREDATMRMPPLPTLEGAAAIAGFLGRLRERGELGRIRAVPTRANGRPAVVMRRLADGAWSPHGVIVLDVQGSRIGRLDAFIDGSLVPRFEARARAAARSQTWSGSSGSRA